MGETRGGINFHMKKITMNRFAVTFYTFFAAFYAASSGFAFAIGDTHLGALSLFAVLAALVLLFMETSRTWWLPFWQLSISCHWMLANLKCGEVRHISFGPVHLHFGGRR